MVAPSVFSRCVSYGPNNDPHRVTIMRDDEFLVEKSRSTHASIDRAYAAREQATTSAYCDKAPSAGL